MSDILNRVLYFLVVTVAMLNTFVATEAARKNLNTCPVLRQVSVILWTKGTRYKPANNPKNYYVLLGLRSGSVHCWGDFGGGEKKCDCRNLTHAALREVQEETGLKLLINGHTFYRDPVVGRHSICRTFIAFHPFTTHVKLSGAHHAWVWVSLSDLLAAAKAGPCRNFVRKIYVYTGKNDRGNDIKRGTSSLNLFDRFFHTISDKDVINELQEILDGHRG